MRNTANSPFSHTKNLVHGAGTADFKNRFADFAAFLSDRNGSLACWESGEQFYQGQIALWIGENHFSFESMTSLITVDVFSSVRDEFTLLGLFGVLDVNNLVLANNHAASLLITRSNATEAVKLTMAVLSKAPESSIARINHALALAQMARYDDAESQLAKLQITSLDEQEQTFYHFARLDCAAGLGRFEDARKEIELVELRYLFPPQIEWITQMRVRIAPKSGE